MKQILFLSWRDIKHPKHGGAENFTHEMMKRLVKKGYSITHFACGFEKSETQETIDGVQYIRGSRSPLKIIFDAHKYIKEFGSFDWVVEQRNTHHFFTRLWLPKTQPRALFIHHVTREQWFTECGYLIGTLGRIQEILTLKWINSYPAFTASKSTADELIGDYGFNADRVFDFHQGLNVPPPALQTLPAKSETPQFIFVGRFSRYKGIDAAILAMKSFYEKIGAGRLVIVGQKNKKFEQKIWQPLLKKYPELGQYIHFTGFVSDAERDRLMAQSHAIVVPSNREGWGIIVTEANAQNTPAIVYPSQGLEEAVDYGRTGLICSHKTPQSLADSMIKIWQDPSLRKELTDKARTWSESFDWDIAAGQADIFFQNPNLLALFNK